jgi:adenine C2-methylase RlmN of 23S rRNA A2503 and tRNA A37
MNTLEKPIAIADRLWCVKSQASKIDIAEKFIFAHKAETLAGQKSFFTEMVYVDNGSGKDIICVPSQTGCKMGCKFCHLTQRKEQDVTYLNAYSTAQCVEHVLKERAQLEKNFTLLISMMGMGEPLLNSQYIFTLYDHMIEIAAYQGYDKLRFGVSTMVPSIHQLRQVIGKSISNPDYDIKLHWSLHHPDPIERYKFMPNACQDLNKIGALLQAHSIATGRSDEVHYTLFDGNDNPDCARQLVDLLLKYELPVKFIRFSERSDHEVASSKRKDDFIASVREMIDGRVVVEEYTPPGADINGCCGEFELDYSDIKVPRG